MKRRSISMLLSVLAGISTISTYAKSARADQDFNSPFFPGTFLFVNVGQVSGTNVQYVIYQDQSTGFCDVQNAGSSGLRANTNVNGTSVSDVINVVTSGTVTVGCSNLGSIVLKPLVYNGFFLDVYAKGGNDTVFGGAGDSWSFGEDGNDAMFNQTPIGRTFGGPGNDKVTGRSSIATDHLEGNDGDDCLFDPGNAHSTFDCGGQVVLDKFVAPASGAGSCEHQVASCN